MSLRGIVVDARQSNLAFMLSNWYSGATLLAILLNNNSHLISNGETFPFLYDIKNANLYSCSCGEHMSSCPFYSRAANSLREDDLSWSSNFSVLPQVSPIAVINRLAMSFDRSGPGKILMSQGTPLRRVLDGFLCDHLKFYHEARKISNAKCYVDGTKSIRRAELFARYNSRDIKVLHLIRDGRGFCRSYLKNKNLSNDQLPLAMTKWKEYIKMVDVFVMRYPNTPITTVRYEDLCSHPQKTLKFLCDFLDVPWESSMGGVPTEHHMLGNRMRKGFDGNIVEDLSWREFFTLEEIELIELGLKPQLVRFGYLSDKA